MKGLRPLHASQEFKRDFFDNLKPFGECAHQLSLPATPDSHIHLRPRGSGQRSWTQGRAQHDQGGKQKANGGKLAFIRAVQAFTCHGVSSGSAAFQFKPTDFYVTHRFFVTFLVRPALLPYGKRGFRAAIYKIARPQPPAAAL